jgi:biopolymer transport protein TolQ
MAAGRHSIPYLAEGRGSMNTDTPAPGSAAPAAADVATTPGQTPAPATGSDAAAPGVPTPAATGSAAAPPGQPPAPGGEGVVPGQPATPATGSDAAVPSLPTTPATGGAAATTGQPSVPGGEAVAPGQPSTPATGTEPAAAAPLTAEPAATTPPGPGTSPIDAGAASALPATPDGVTAGLPADQAAALASDHSILGLILQAGPVVQGVMLALALASVVCWAIMIEKGILLGGLKREIGKLGRAGAGADAPQGEGLSARIQRAAAREWAEGREPGESRGEYRERIERAMRETLTGALRRAQSGTAFLATTGAIGPFVGLFGTVWGIMGSFQGIAASRDTSLAVVAPGIAEALLATAIGLFAAIPAVIGYNRIARRVAGLRADGLAAISAIGARLSARPPRGGQMRAAE